VLILTAIFRKEYFFHEPFLMAWAEQADSFDSSLGQCYGNAENRVLKRVGGTNYFL